MYLGVNCDMREECMNQRVECRAVALDIYFPFRVYQDYGGPTPEGDPLLTLEAGFRDREDAELFVKVKSEIDHKKYVVKDNTDR